MLGINPSEREETKAASSAYTARVGFFAASLARVETVSKKKVLIVDDNSINRKILLRVLPDCECVEAADGKQAVDEVKKALDAGTHFDLVLMDLEMPVMDGQAATNEIRKLGTLIPILCVSTTVTNQKQFETLTSGMNDFLQKPVNKTEVRDAVQKYGSLSATSPRFEPNTPRSSFFFAPPTAPIAIPNKEEPNSPIDLSKMGLAASPAKETSPILAVLSNPAAPSSQLVR